MDICLPDDCKTEKVTTLPNTLSVLTLTSQHRSINVDMSIQILIERRFSENKKSGNYLSRYDLIYSQVVFLLVKSQKCMKFTK